MSMAVSAHLTKIMRVVRNLTLRFIGFIYDKHVSDERSEIMGQTIFAAQIDVREHHPRDKHRVIFETFGNLKPGSQMEIINDHDPKPLYYQFQAERSGEFSWEYLEDGPEVWRVAIGRN